MKRDRIDPQHGPTPKQFAAYADGELSAAECARVEDWLARSPDAAADVDAWQHLTQLCRDTAPPAPSEARWESVRQRIDIGLRPKQARSRPRSWWPRLSLTAAAATVLAVLLLSKEQLPAEEPFAVVDAADVAVMSIPGDACACLVAAQPPVHGVAEHELAREQDVVVLNLEPHEDGSLADALSPEGAPTMITPPAGWNHDEP